MNVRSNRRRELVQRGAALLAACAAPLVLAQAPADHVTILCSGPAGSIPDIVARLVAEQLGGRSSFMPDVSTLAEQGWPELVVREWFAFFLPGRSTAEVVDAASRAWKSVV